MKTVDLLVLTISLVMFGCAKTTVSENSEPPDSAISGGSVVKAEDSIARSTVLIMLSPPKGGVFSNCSASIIAPDLLLTAAHCLTTDASPFRSPQVLYVRFQREFSYDIPANIDLLDADVSAGHLIYPQDVIIQDGYHFSETVSLDHENHDIALIHLRFPIPKAYQPLKLDTSRSSPKPGSKITLAGYGPPSEGLQVFTLRSLPSQLTTPTNNAFLLETKNQIGSKPIGNSFGDSGGPALSIRDGQLYQFGVYTGGIAYIGNKISTFESVAHHLTWIREAAKTLGSSATFE
jgi:hypothetical protein